MLRIQCKCGKFLKVNESLAGKKIKCPSCSEVVLVKAAEEQFETPEVLDEDAAPAPPPKKMAAAKQDTSAQAPKKRKAQDDDDEDGPPRKKKKAKKKDNTKLLLIAGGCGALVLVAVVVGAVFMFTGGEEKTKTPTPPAPAKDGKVLVSFEQQHKKGDRREVKIRAELKTTVKVEDETKLSPERKKGLDSENGRFLNLTAQGVVRSLDVNSKGEETKVQITISRFNMETEAKKESNKEMVVIGTRSNDSRHWSFPELKGRSEWYYMACRGLISDDYLDTLGASFGVPSSEANGPDWFNGGPKSLGSSWNLDKSKLKQALFSEDDKRAVFGVGKEQFGIKEIKGTVKVVGNPTEGDKKYVDVDIAIDCSLEEPKVSGSGTGKISYSVRTLEDESTGPVKKINKVKIDFSGVDGSPDTEKPDDRAKIRVTMVYNVTTEIKYLEPEPIGEDKNGPTSGEPVNIRLAGNPNVQWIEPQQAFNVSVNYSLVGAGKPKADTVYILYVKVADSDGIKKSYEVQAQPGSAMVPSGAFINPSIRVSMPSVNRPASCDIVLMEKSGNNPEVEIARLDNIAISGINATPAPGRVSFELTGAAVDQLSNKKETRFTVDYKVTSSNPDPNKTYRLIVNFEGKTKLQAKPYEVKGSQLSGQDTIVKKSTFEVPVGTKFTMWLTEDNGTESASVKVSKEVKGEVAAAVSDAMPLQVQITNAVAIKSKSQPQLGGGAGGFKGGKGGGAIPKGNAQQQFAVSFAWNLTSGTFDSKAKYAFVVEFKGGSLPGLQPLAPPLPGNQVPKTGTFTTQPIPYSGQSGFEMHVVEIVAGQEPRRISNMLVGKVQ